MTQTILEGMHQRWPSPKVLLDSVRQIIKLRRFVFYNYFGGFVFLGFGGLLSSTTNFWVCLFS